MVPVYLQYAVVERRVPLAICKQKWAAVCVRMQDSQGTDALLACLGTE